MLQEYHDTNRQDVQNDTTNHRNDTGEYAMEDYNSTTGDGYNGTEISAFNESLTNEYNGTETSGFNGSLIKGHDKSIKSERFMKYQRNGIFNIKKTSPEYTICQKMSVTEDKTIVQYLFDEGKCGKICRKGTCNFLTF